MDTSIEVPEESYLAYPPVVESVEIIGYIKDQNGIGYSRDIGRSFQLAGKTYYIFGDTFCKNKDGDFVGISNNTVARVDDIANFAVSRYQKIDEIGKVDTFLKLTDEETAFELQNKGKRVMLWAFGGAVELQPGVGRVWYQKFIDHGYGDSEYCGAGVASIIHSEPHIHGHTGHLVTHRYPIWFGPDEPKVGSFSYINVKGQFVYLFGEYKGKIILASVNKSLTLNRASYRFWNGEEYVQNCDEAVAVFKGIPQGAIIRSDLFGKERPWVLIGVDKWADSEVQMGTAPKLGGPWEIEPVCEAKGIDQDKGWRYCIYPHTWALRSKDELMVTWSEQWPGGVVAAKLKFQKSAETEPDSEMDAEGESDEQKNARMEHDSELDAEGETDEEVYAGVKLDAEQDAEGESDEPWWL